MSSKESSLIRVSRKTLYGGKIPAEIYVDGIKVGDIDYFNNKSIDIPVTIGKHFIYALASPGLTSGIIRIDLDKNETAEIFCEIQGSTFAASSISLQLDSSSIKYALPISSTNSDNYDKAFEDKIKEQTNVIQAKAQELSKAGARNNTTSLVGVIGFIFVVALFIFIFICLIGALY